MKGISFTFEAVIASIILLSVLFFFKPINVPEASEVSHKVTAYNGLKVLDSTESLRKNVLKNNATAIKNDLSTYLSYLNYDVVIYNLTSNLTAIPTTIGDVISLSYFLTGDRGNYTTREVRVFLWGFD